MKGSKRLTADVSSPIGSALMEAPSLCNCLWPQKLTVSLDVSCLCKM